jgi:hypothetical protein
MIHTDHLAWSLNNTNTYEQHHAHPHHATVDYNPHINVIEMSSPHEYSSAKGYPLDFTDMKASQHAHESPMSDSVTINSASAADNNILQSNEFQSFLEFNGKSQYQSPPENQQPQVNGNKQQFMDDSLFSDIFQNYSMENTNTQNQTHEDGNNSSNNNNNLNTTGNSDNNGKATIDELLHEKHDLFKSPYINTSNLTRSSSAETPDTMGGNSTTDDFTPLLSPTTTTLFDTINPNILPASEFSMPVSFFEGNSSPSLEALNNGSNIPSEETKVKRLRKARKPSSSSVSKVTKAPSPLMRPNMSSRRLSTRVPTSTGSYSTNASPVISTSVNRNYSSSMAQYSKSMSPEEQHSESSESSAAEMPPPARNVTIGANGPLPAATPASLMNLPEQDVDMADISETENHLKDAVQATKNIAIQASVVATPPPPKPTKKRIPRTSKTAPSSATSSPLIAAAPPTGSRKKSTPILAPHERSKSSTNSIMIKPKVSIAASPVLIASLRHTGGRNSISSSPIIMPKISPHMSPHIVPMGSGNGSRNNGNNGGGSSDDLSALLASKSNYQNIVEGNHNQLGLLYPDTLSADLTSKRTSHKLAEQGRRNRINTALGDLAKLIVPDANQAPSKATTVELAIKRINELKTELEGCKDRLRKYEEV